MNIIEVVRKAIQEFPDVNKLVHIDFNNDSSEEYGLYPTGDTLVSEDILGNQTRRHTFVFYAVLQSVSDYDRLANSGTLLALQVWLETYVESCRSPISFSVEKHIESQRMDIITGEIQSEHSLQKTVQGDLKKLTCNNGMLYSVPDGTMNSGVQYQLQITAEYKIESEEF